MGVQGPVLPCPTVPWVVQPCSWSAATPSTSSSATSPLRRHPWGSGLLYSLGSLVFPDNPAQTCHRSAVFRNREEQLRSDGIGQQSDSAGSRWLIITLVVDSGGESGIPGCSRSTRARGKNITVLSLFAVMHALRLQMARNPNFAQLLHSSRGWN